MRQNSSKLERGYVEKPAAETFKLLSNKSGQAHNKADPTESDRIQPRLEREFATRSNVASSKPLKPAAMSEAANAVAAPAGPYIVS